MMDCKNALKETAGDVEAAIDFLRKKGLAGAEKKAGRSTTEGLIASYIHAGSGCTPLDSKNIADLSPNQHHMKGLFVPTACRCS